MSALFKRNDKTTIAELEDYYANQQTNRNARAWAMAFLSLLITVAVIVALFFGVRWLWRTLVEDDGAKTDSSETTDTQLPTFDEFDKDTRVVDNSSDENGATGSQSSENEGVVSNEAATTNESNAGRLANNTGTESQGSGNVAGQATDDDNISAVGGETTVTEVPNTGTGELVVLMPLAAGVIGYAISRKNQLR